MKKKQSRDMLVNKRNQRLRNRYPEVHGKTVDFISHSVEDDTLFFSIRFADQTDFSLRYRCQMFPDGADLCDVKGGNFELIRRYNE